jgi:DNA-directed RNA polymerase specialized sigma24 family protein
VVSREDIRALYAAHRDQAIRLAHRLGANGDSEDCVHDVVLWLIERQDYLEAPPTRAYFFTAVRRAVLERFRSSYVQRTVWVDPPELVDLEAMQYALEHGRPRTPEVSLPAPP